MVAILIYYTANLVKEVPPIAKVVTSQSGEVLYTYDDVVQGKGYFQQFDLMDYGTMLGMGAYMGPDFSTEFMHKRAEFLYDYFAKQKFGKFTTNLSKTELAVVKAMTIADFKEKTTLKEDGTTYTDASTLAYKANVDYLVKFLVNGDASRAWRGGVIHEDEAVKIAAFVDWSQMVASSLRPNTDRTWSNNWPAEPMIDQNIKWNFHMVSLWEFLLLWTATILVIFSFMSFLANGKKMMNLKNSLLLKNYFPPRKSF